jgi:mannose-1-phosphate guanylyltransferase
MFKSEDLQVIVLSSGEDFRLNPLVESLGEPVLPKQFASIVGNRSLLQQTVMRYVGLVPPEHIIVVVQAAHEGVARVQLSDWPGIEIITRPAKCGAGLDLLLPLGRVFGRSPAARAVVTPADHYVPYPEGLIGSLVAANCALDDLSVVLFGVAGGQRRGKQAWIVPGPSLRGPIFSVAGLMEGASPLQSAELVAAGALWNTSTMVARVECLWYQAARQFPLQAEAVARLWAEKGSLARTVEKAYLNISSVESSRGLLSGAKDLATIAVHGSGWTDWTSPEEVMDSIQDSSELEHLLARILEQQRVSGRTQRRSAMACHHATAA